MHEVLKAFTSFIFGALLMLTLLCFTDCKSTGTRTSNDILEYQRQIDRLEEELRTRDRAIDNAVRELRIITERSAAMEGTVDDVIELFGQYQRAVNELLRYYNDTVPETAPSD